MTTTPYAAHKLVNVALQEAGLTKRIPPQMMYNYTAARVNAGKAPFIAYTPEGGVDVADLERWTQAYIAKQAVKAEADVEADTPIEGLETV